MDWLIAGVLLVLIVTVLVRLKKAERRRRNRRLGGDLRLAIRSVCRDEVGPVLTEGAGS